VYPGISGGGGGVCVGGGGRGAKEKEITEEIKVVYVVLLLLCMRVESFYNTRYIKKTETHSHSSTYDTV
jgi:hypothetical protein